MPGLVAPPRCAVGPYGRLGLENLGVCMQYSWLLPHLSNRAAERLYKFMLSYGDYLCQLFLCQKQYFLMLHLCCKCPTYTYPPFRKYPPSSFITAGISSEAY